MPIRPGEIYYINYEHMEPHPVVIVSREELNRGKYVVAVECTSSRYDERASLPNCVPFNAGQFGFAMDCVAKADSITFIPISDVLLDDGPVGVLDDIAMRSLIRAIGHVIDSECEPE